MEAEVRRLCNASTVTHNCSNRPTRAAAVISRRHHSIVHWLIINTKVTSKGVERTNRVFKARFKGKAISSRDAAVTNLRTLLFLGKFHGI